MSPFSGSAWQWDPATGQYFLASFYPEQADLNWHNSEVRRAMTDVLRFWSERGVDGFRVDVVHRLAKDPELRDKSVPGPALLDPWAPGRKPGWYAALRLYDENRPEGHAYLRQMRAGVGPHRLLVGEVWILDVEQIATYLGPDESDLAFNFPFAFNAWEAETMAATIEATELTRPATAGFSPERARGPATALRDRPALPSTLTPHRHRL